jgi:hypothetical protein
MPEKNCLLSSAAKLGTVCKFDKNNQKDEHMESLIFRLAFPKGVI